MNKTLLAFLTGASLGFGVGAVAGYLWTTKKLEEISDESTQEFEETEEEIRETRKKVSEISETYHPEVSKNPEDYTAYFDEAREEAAKEVAEPDFELQDTVGENMADMAKGAHAVSEDEFGEKREYDMQDWTYYTVDDVYVNEQDEVVENFDYFLGNGPEIYDFEDSVSQDERTLWIVNDKLMTYFQITKIYGSYNDEGR